MTIEFAAYTAPMVPLVAAFNRRLQERGSSWEFFRSHEPEWLPPGSDVEQSAWREYYLAIENHEHVRGGYCLKPQRFLVRGEAQVITSFQGPVSEGLVDRKYSLLGMLLVRDMLERRPLLLSWGPSPNLTRLLKSLGWTLIGTPFCLYVVHPRRFLRRNRFLRGNRWNRLALDVLATCGVGWLGLSGLHAALGMRGLGAGTARAEEVGSFGPWADELWARAAGRYAMVARRDAAAMNELLPAAGWPRATRLRIADRDGATVGWAAVMDTQMHDDKRFGSLRVGSIVDCFADPMDAPKVVAAALRFLCARGVDIVCSNQTHPAWLDGFRTNGFLVLPDRRILALSEALAQALTPLEELRRGLHLTPLDGDGPHGF